MNNELRPYDGYKKTDLLWLDSIPEHWEMTRNKNVMMLSKDTVGKNHSNYVLLSLTKKGIIARDMENAKGKFPKEFDTYQIVNPGDIVFCLFDIDETPRTVGLSSKNGMITGAYTVFKIENINPKYLYYYYLSIDNNKKLKPLYTGLRKVINTDTFLRTKMPNPPQDEQDKIVKFLDFQLSKINKFIKAKKKLIAALKEQKQAVINEAVTKGINPNAKMKTSGIEWLGDIPQHWEIKRAKYYLMQIDKKSNDGKEQLLTVSHITGVTPRSEKNVNMFMAESTEGYKICEKDMIAINTMWAWMGAIGVSRYNGIISPSYHTYKQKHKDNYDNDYLDNLLRVNGYIDEYRIRSTGIRSSRLRLYPDKFLEIFIVRPPLSEQKDIGKYIHKKSESINRSIYSIEQEIELITEYRTSLISDVVTGKVDVRHIEIDDIIEEDTEIDETEDKIIESEEDINIGESGE